MSFFPRLEIIPSEYFNKIHEASKKILKETGVVYHSTEALEIFKKHGAKVENETVFFSDELLEKVIKSFEAKFELTGRAEGKSIIIGEGSVIQPNIGPVFIQDFDKSRRVGTLKDFINFQKLCQATEIVDITGTSPVDTSDLDQQTKHMRMMFESLKATNKPLIGYVTDTKRVRQTLDLVERAVGGKAAFEANHFVGIGVNPLSPLKWAPESCDTIIEYAKRNQAVFILPCILAGVSGPISLMETIILQNTEILSGIALAKLTNPKTAVVYAPGSTAAYMKTGSYCTGTPEGMMLNLANIQMGREFYGLPTRTMSGMTSAKYPDCQAGYETMQNLMIGILGGANIIMETLGTLDSLMATSYEKFILDVEMLERVKHISKGFNGFDVSFSTETIQDVGHDKSFIEHDNTFEHFRDRWEPSISDWDSYVDWEDSGSPDITVKANKKWKEILAKAPDSVISADTEKDLKNLLDSFSK